MSKNQHSSKRPDVIPTTAATMATSSEAPVDESERTFEFQTVDSRISYPSYKSFDQFVDVQALKNLDSYVTEKIKHRTALKGDHAFFTGPYKLDAATPSLPGSRMIYLSASDVPDSYFDLDQTERWHLTEAAREFSLLMDFISMLPFKATGRMLIMYDDQPRPVTPHRDHVETEICHEFLWFRTNLRKPFYMLNHQTNEKKYVESYTAWFDTVNQFHGSDAADGLTFSIRVDGTFTEDFRKNIPIPQFNAASTPSLWAAITP